MSLGVPESSVHKLVEWIDTIGGLLQVFGADPVVRNLVAALYSGSWFRLPCDSQYIVSCAGGRQGCKLGALVFNMVYALALSTVALDLKSLGILLKVKVTPGTAFWCDRCFQMSWSSED